jgi:N-acyl-D-amino-acid deacylase
MERWVSLILLAMVGCASTITDVDVVIRNGTVYNGTAGPPVPADVVVVGDRIEWVGDASGYRGRTEIDAQGLEVAPGFINMLSWAATTLIADGRSQSDIRQGVTLEVFGEGWSYGPLTDEMKTGEYMEGLKGAFRFDVEWTTRGAIPWISDVGTSYPDSTAQLPGSWTSISRVPGPSVGRCCPKLVAEGRLVRASE